MKQPPEDSDCTNDLSQWFHCANNRGIPDDVLSKAWNTTKNISFVFHHRSAKVVAAEPEKKKKEKEKKIHREDEDDYVDLESNGDDSEEDYV